MTTRASMLVDIDAVAADHQALEQAVGLATRCGARVKIVDVCHVCQQAFATS